MDTRTEKIYTEEQMNERFKPAEIDEHFKPINPTPRQVKRRKVGRNETCPCGSGVKFKKCCLNRQSFLSGIMQ